MAEQEMNLFRVAAGQPVLVINTQRFPCAEQLVYSTGSLFSTPEGVQAVFDSHVDFAIDDGWRGQTLPVEFVSG